MNDVKILGGRRGKGFCDNSTKASVIKRDNKESKNDQNLLTSFMDDPFAINVT